VEPQPAALVMMASKSSRRNAERFFAGGFAGGIANALRAPQARRRPKLFLGDDDFAAVGGEDADSGFVELEKSDIRNAAGEEGDAGAARTGGGKGQAEAAEEKIVVDTREEPFRARRGREVSGRRCCARWPVSRSVDRSEERARRR